MPDVYATIAGASPEVQERLADVIEQRAADPQYQAMVRAYLAEVPFPPRAQVLEVGCGTGSITRTLASWLNVAHALGVDPSPVFLARARALSAGIGNVAFEQADGRSLPLAAERFDAVVVNTTLSHVPNPERLLAEVFRVLRAGGSLAVFDGDYATATVALNALDPLERCVEAFRASFVNDPWLMRRLPQLVREAGFERAAMRSYGYVESSNGGYMLTWIDRGADALAASGALGRDAADALKGEARRRSETGTWFGHIAFGAVIACKPR